MPKPRVTPDSRNGAANLTTTVQQLVGAGPEAFTPEDWASLCEQTRLQALYPRQYVAWRDHYEGEGNERRLVRREVLCASTNAEEVRRHLGQISSDGLYGVFMDYIESPDELPLGR